ncbi:hypothetical protein SOM08_14390 [Hydrogenophaga sp. SNF1]|uniref:hypothetical protein n=1 Tax=Hydrogenophaga sp. SNF1 TaxID=3098762 RepID=UPI002ACC2500|nr:hypothetical protein [Hydrogenophaga sp. SNF1]WQB82186.1 hypothetical protein SOM08_14390 [Hydrogenophaga sp. SNF1]
MQPWHLRRSDFVPASGPQIDPNIGFELFFEYLRLSPSYELARQEAAGKLQSGTPLPTDFEQVRNTFRLLGDVQQVLFRQWWRARGLKAFGKPNARPRVHRLLTMPSDVQVEVGVAEKALAHYLNETRQDEGMPSAALLAIPLGMKQADLLDQIRKALEGLSGPKASGDVPALQLQSRIRRKDLMTGIRLLWLRAARPTWELWRLGAQAQVSPTYSHLDPKGSRKVKDPEEIGAREMLTKMTLRALNKAEARAENAARGRFPSEALCPQVPFDYPRLARIIKQRRAWEAKEKERQLHAAK